MTFKVKYNMTKDAKQNLLKYKYGQTQRVNTCFEKLETFIDLYFTDADISQDEGGKFIYKFMDEEQVFRLLALEIISGQAYYYMEKMVKCDLKKLYIKAKELDLKFP